MVNNSRRFQVLQSLILRDKAVYGPSDERTILEHKFFFYFYFFPILSFSIPWAKQIGLQPNTCALEVFICDMNLTPLVLYLGS